ncbi:MAG TPA: MaoC family dehydratase, partial [Geminicoccaceae bacterium]|nr:MaoC family dehydratase [Geminicoccaceae bacterium]
MVENGASGNGVTTKSWAGSFFEDFALGRRLRHATPRTVTAGDAALYLALTGSRFALHGCDGFARQAGLPRAPLDDLLAFNLVFGKSVPDVSQNAVADLGYADGRFGALLYPGDGVAAESEVIGLKPTGAGKAGVVYVRTRGAKPDGRMVVEFVRWVLVRRRRPVDPGATAVTGGASHVPRLPDHVPAAELNVPAGLRPRGLDPELSGSPHLFEDYAVGERIDHLDGAVIGDSEHRLATRLYQNTARAHFDAHREREGRFGRCVVYGGHVVSVARALSFNGLGNALHVAAINGGRHIAPCFAGDTLYAWTEVLDRAALPNRSDLGALRLRLIATKNRPCADFPYRDETGKYDP